MSSSTKRHGDVSHGDITNMKKLKKDTSMNRNDKTIDSYNDDDECPVLVGRDYVNARDLCGGAPMVSTRSVGDVTKWYIRIKGLHGHLNNPKDDINIFLDELRPAIEDVCPVTITPYVPREDGLLSLIHLVGLLGTIDMSESDSEYDDDEDEEGEEDGDGDIECNSVSDEGVDVAFIQEDLESSENVDGDDNISTLLTVNDSIPGCGRVIGIADVVEDVGEVTELILSLPLISDLSHGGEELAEIMYKEDLLGVITCIDQSLVDSGIDGVEVTTSVDAVTAAERAEDLAILSAQLSSGGKFEICCRIDDVSISSSKEELQRHVDILVDSFASLGMTRDMDENATFSLQGRSIIYESDRIHEQAPRDLFFVHYSSLNIDTLSKGNPLNVIFEMYVPSTPDPQKVYAHMCKCAQYVASRFPSYHLLSGSDGCPLKIDAEMSQILDMVSRMRAIGVVPGGENSWLF